MATSFDLEKALESKFYHQVSSTWKGSALYTAMLVCYWPRAARGGVLGVLGMSVLLVKSTNSTHYSSSLHCSDPLAFPRKFAPLRYSFSRVLIGYNS